MDDHISVITDNKLKSLHEYPFINKHKAILWGALYLAVGLSISIYGVILDKGRILLGLTGIWAILLPLILLAIWTERRNSIVLSSVRILSNGIEAQLRDIEFKWFPQSNVQFVPWSDISSYQYFSYPDYDAVEMNGKGGVKLFCKNKDKQIVIYEYIKDYTCLNKIIENQLPRGQK